MSTSVLKALPSKLDIKRHSHSILYFFQIWPLLSEPIDRTLKVQIYRIKNDVISTCLFHSCLSFWIVPQW